MERSRSAQVSAEQWRAYYLGLSSIKGDPEVLEDLGIPVAEETLYAHVAAGAEVAELLKATEEPDPYAGLTGKQCFRAAMEALAQRSAS